MKDLIECKICNKKVTNNNSYIGSHVKRKHGMLLNEYCLKLYENIGDDIELKKCKMCDSIIYPTLEIDHKKGTYLKIGIDYYICNVTKQSIKCKDLISRYVFDEKYNKRKYEHIGANTKFLSLVYNIDEDEAKKLKGISKYSIHKKNTKLNDNEIEALYNKKIIDLNNKPHRSNLMDYKIRYGEIEGERRYNDRNYKIGLANNINWYINKYGEKEGNERWASRIRKYEKSSGNSVSKAQLIFAEKVLNNIQFETEYTIYNNEGKLIFIDFFIPSRKIALEFFGDYWHCNPRKFHSEYYHKVLKMSAGDIWKRDAKRIDDIFSYFNKDITVIVVWEGSNIGADDFMNIINNLPRTRTKIEI